MSTKKTISRQKSKFKKIFRGKTGIEAVKVKSNAQKNFRFVEDYVLDYVLSDMLISDLLFLKLGNKEKKNSELQI